MAKSPALNRQAYIDAALEVVAEVGVDKLSMRKVASRLGVSAMAMYKHFPNKEELLTATLDEVIARADVLPETELPWAQWVEKVARGMYDTLCEEISWVPFLGSMRLGSQAAAVTDAFVKRLTTEGFTVEQAVRAYFSVIQVMIGAVCLHSSISAEPKAEDGKLTPLTLRYLENVDPDRLRIAPALDELAKLDQLDIGLPMIIDSLRATLAASNI